MKKRITNRLKEVKDMMLRDESTVSDPETRNLIQNHINQIDELNRQFGENTNQENIYRLEPISNPDSGKIFRARKSYGKKREGFYIGNAAAVKQYIKEHPDVYFNNLGRYGLKP